MSMLTYRAYLHLEELLRLQVPVGPEPGTDERLFIVAHQVHELWFTLLLDALEETRDRLLTHDLPGTRRRLARVISLQRLHNEQIELLDTISPWEFASFRGHLGTASGIQSAQYHEVEFLLGIRDRGYLRR